MSGTSERPLTRSPVGEIEPSGATLDLELFDVFRFTDDGRFAEEWCRYDNRGFLAQLGVEDSPVP